MNKKEVKKAPALRFKGFTNDWEQRKLKEVVNINPSTNVPNTFNYVDLNSVKGVSLIKVKKINKKEAPSRAQRVAKNGDIFYQMVRPYQKNNYLFNKPKTSFPYVFSTGYAQLRSIKTSPSYIFPLLQKSDFVNKVLAHSTGTSYPAINSRDLGQIKIYLPNELVEQNKIGEIFQKINKIIELQQRKNCLTKKIVSALSKQLTNPQFIIKCQNTQVPKKHNVLLKEIINYKNGKSHEKNQKNTGQFELVNLNSISKSGKLKTSGKYVNDTEECLKKGDIVMILSDIARGQLIGLTAVIPKDKYYVLNQRIALLHPIKKLNSVFLSSYLNNQQQYFKRVAAGMSQINISKKDVENFKLRIPDLSTQNFFGTIINQLNNFIDNNQNKSKQLIVFKEFLLQNMFI